MKTKWKMKSVEQIIPKYATHPGEILLDELEAIEMSQSTLARQIGYKKSQINEIIKGKRNINGDLAILLEKVLGIDASYWLDAQMQYEIDRARIDKKNQKRLEAIEQWKLIENHIAVAFFKKEKILTGDPLEDVPFVKKIYGVRNFEELASLKARPTYSRFRKSTQLKLNPVNILGWVKLVHFKSKVIIVKPFEHEQKEELFQYLRGILFENKNTLHRIKEKLGDYGIKLVYQRKGEQTPVDGISFWSNGHPAIGMSLRHKRLDNFAFTLFHELGHVYEHLINNSQAEFVDLINSKEQKEYKDSIEEKEADIFAQNNLIHPEKWEEFFDEKIIYSDERIKKFARENLIHPCIIRGRICFTKKSYKGKSSIEYAIG